MIVTVTPNPAVDLTITTPLVARGETTVVENAAARAGGKGLNVARVLTQTGFEVCAIAPVGRSDVDWFDADLGPTPHRLVGCATPTRRSYVLHETDQDVTSVINERGSARTDREWAAVEAAIVEALREPPGTARCLAVCGSLPPGADGALLDRLLRPARAAGLAIAVDTSGPWLRAAADAGATLLKPNRAELAAATGTGDAIAGARRLQALGAAIVVVSLGAQGLVVVPPAGRPWQARLPHPLRGNPTGAGDAAVAAALTFLAAPADVTRLRAGDPDLVVALARRAAAWSAAAVLMPGAGAIHDSYPSIERSLELTPLE